MTDLGENIARKRKLLKLTQEQLAEASNITTHYLSKLERGVMKNTSAYTLFRISKSLDCSMEDLISPVKSTFTTDPEQEKLKILIDQLPNSQKSKYLRIFQQIIRLALGQNE